MITSKQDSESPLVRFLLVLFTAVSLITTVICIYASPHFPDPGFTLSDGCFFVASWFLLSAIWLFWWQPFSFGANCFFSARYFLAFLFCLCQFLWFPVFFFLFCLCQFCLACSCTTLPQARAATLTLTSSTIIRTSGRKFFKTDTKADENSWLMQLRPHPVIQLPGHFGAWQLKWWEEAELVFRKLQFPPGFDPPSLAFCASYNPFPFAKTLPIAVSVGRISLKRWNIMQLKTYFCDFFSKRSHHVQFQSGEKEPVIFSDSINRVFPGFKILRLGVKWITNIWCDRFTRLWFIRGNTVLGVHRKLWFWFYNCIKVLFRTNISKHLRTQEKRKR